MSDARVLAELLVEKCGWTWDCQRCAYEGEEYTLDRHEPDSIKAPDGKRAFFINSLDYSMDSMKLVWKVLKERGLWDEFEQECCNKVRPSHAHDWVYRMLMDGKGQIKAAIKVFKEAQG